jgi:hypothetical protein
MPTCSAGPARATANLKLTFHQNHSAGLINLPQNGLQPCAGSRQLPHRPTLPDRDRDSLSRNPRLFVARHL